MATPLNTDHLREGLEEYNSSLNRHITRLEDDFNVLQQYYNFLSQAYEGRAAEEFKYSWLQTAQWFQDYINDAKTLSKFLEERRTALNQNV